MKTIIKSLIVGFGVLTSASLLEAKVSGKSDTEVVIAGATGLVGMSPVKKVDITEKMLSDARTKNKSVTFTIFKACIETNEPNGKVDLMLGANKKFVKGNSFTITRTIGGKDVKIPVTLVAHGSKTKDKHTLKPNKRVSVKGLATDDGSSNIKKCGNAMVVEATIQAKDLKSAAAGKYDISTNLSVEACN